MVLASVRGLRLIVDDKAARSVAALPEWNTWARQVCCWKPVCSGALTWENWRSRFGISVESCGFPQPSSRKY